MNSEEKLDLRRFCQLWVLLLLLHKVFHEQLFGDVLQNDYSITYWKLLGKPLHHSPLLVMLHALLVWNIKTGFLQNKEPPNDSFYCFGLCAFMLTMSKRCVGSVFHKIDFQIMNEIHSIFHDNLITHQLFRIIYSLCHECCS